MNDVNIYRAAALDGVAHGFLGRRGGVSTGVHAGLNVGVGSEDDPDAVLENRRRATDAVLPGASLVTVFQVHSPDVVRVDALMTLPGRPSSDARVTIRPGLFVGSCTA